MQINTYNNPIKWYNGCFMDAIKSPHRGHQARAANAIFLYLLKCFFSFIYKIILFQQNIYILFISSEFFRRLGIASASLAPPPAPMAPPPPLARSYGNSWLATSSSVFCLHPHTSQRCCRVCAPSSPIRDTQQDGECAPHGLFCSLRRPG